MQKNHLTFVTALAGAGRQQFARRGKGEIKNENKKT